MGGKVSDKETKTILTKLAILFPSFYAILFIFEGILSGAFGITYRGDLSFDHISVGFDTPRGEAAFTQLVLSFVLVSTALVFFIVNNTSMAWDYSVTIAFFHVCLACIVMGKFPTNWIWWLAMIVAMVVQIVVGELAHYFLVDLRDIKTGN